jgi:ABC-type nickel/cobalt efflux system permease component RcnA
MFPWHFADRFWKSYLFIFVYYCLLRFSLSRWCFRLVSKLKLMSARKYEHIDAKTFTHTHTNKHPHVHTHTHTHHICIDFSVYYETASPLHDAKILIVFLLLFFCICSCCYKQLIVKDGSLKIIHSSLNIWNDI